MKQEHAIERFEYVRNGGITECRCGWTVQALGLDWKAEGRRLLREHKAEAIEAAKLDATATAGGFAIGR